MQLRRFSQHVKAAHESAFVNVSEQVGGQNKWMNYSKAKCVYNSCIRAPEWHHTRIPAESKTRPSEAESQGSKPGRALWLCGAYSLSPVNRNHPSLFQHTAEIITSKQNISLIKSSDTAMLFVSTITGKAVGICGFMYAEEGR